MKGEIPDIALPLVGIQKNTIKKANGSMVQIQEEHPSIFRAEMQILGNNFTRIIRGMHAMIQDCSIHKTVTSFP